MKQAQIERDFAFHLGVVARDGRSRAIDDNDISSADEMRFLINLDNHRILGRLGDSEVKYSEVVYGSEEMTMLVRISSGRDAIIEALFKTFQH